MLQSLHLLYSELSKVTLKLQKMRVKVKKPPDKSWTFGRGAMVPSLGSPARGPRRIAEGHLVVTKASVSPINISFSAVSYSSEYAILIADTEIRSHD